jgi:hypothetical protein
VGGPCRYPPHLSTYPPSVSGETVPIHAQVPRSTQESPDIPSLSVDDSGGYPQPSGVIHISPKFVHKDQRTIAALSPNCDKRGRHSPVNDSGPNRDEDNLAVDLERGLRGTARRRVGTGRLRRLRWAESKTTCRDLPRQTPSYPRLLPGTCRWRDVRGTSVAVPQTGDLGGPADWQGFRPGSGSPSPRACPRTPLRVRHPELSRAGRDGFAVANPCKSSSIGISP